MLKKLLLAILLILPSYSANSQWKEIADFIGPCPGCLSGQTGEYITAIEFLDQSGPLRVGFIGTESELFRTSDGGEHWKSVWDSGQSYLDYYVTDICFKDSMVGWFTVLNAYGNTDDACYRTSNGGETWELLNVPHALYGAQTICYNPFSNRLFLSVVDTLGDSVWSGMEYSTNDGTDWIVFSSIFSDGFSFFNDSIGIASASSNDQQDTSHEIMRTTDGGISWTLVNLAYSPHASGRGGGYEGCYQPLAIPGTSTCFEVEEGEMLIRRSDDFVQTRRVLKDFGPFQDTVFWNSIAPYSMGSIRGDLSRLYVQTDTGMFVSTDQGITWVYDGGPAQADASFFRFYSENGVTLAGMTYSDGIVEDGGLWEELWPQASVAKEDASTGVLSIYPNPVRDELSIAPGVVGSVQVFDQMGRKVLSSEDDGSGVALDVSHLTNGTYFLRMGTASTKIVIAR